MLRWHPFGSRGGSRGSRLGVSTFLIQRRWISDTFLPGVYSYPVGPWASAVPGRFPWFPFGRVYVFDSKIMDSR